MKKKLNSNMTNPVIDGVILVEAIGPKYATECYPGPSRTSQAYKVKQGPFKNGFNPKKVVFFGEEVVVYAKNITLHFHLDGTVTTLPVETWVPGGSLDKIQRDIDNYGLSSPANDAVMKELKSK